MKKKYRITGMEYSRAKEIYQQHLASRMPDYDHSKCTVLQGFAFQLHDSNTAFIVALDGGGISVIEVEIKDAKRIIQIG